LYALENSKERFDARDGGRIDKRYDAMQIVLIDQFRVPEESKAELVVQMKRVQGFLKTLPGFVEGFVYEKTAGEGRTNLLTTAVWESETAFENARKAASAEFQRIGFNPQETMKKLRVEIERAVYRRSSY
jgi:heme-degrading monooxygenase HmoA